MNRTQAALHGAKISRVQRGIENEVKSLFSPPAEETPSQLHVHDCRKLKKSVNIEMREVDKKIGSLIKTAQGELLRPTSRRESFAWPRLASSRGEDTSSSVSAARILRSCRRGHLPSETVVSLDESLEKNRQYWWIPAGNRDQSAVSFAMQKMNVVVLSEQGVFAHF